MNIKTDSDIKLLMISLDKAIFKKDSVSLERLKLYSVGNIKIFVIVCTNIYEKPIELKNKLYIYPTNSKFKINYFFDALRIFKKNIKKNKISLVSTQDSFETGFIGWVIAKIYKIPLQLQIHTDLFSKYFRRESIANKLRYLLAKFLIPKASSFRVVSDRLKKSIVKNFKIKEDIIIEVPIYCECQISNVKYRIKEQGKKFVFLTVGRLVPVKNIGMQIKAMKNVECRMSNVELWILGDGPEKKNYELRITNYELNNKIKFFGWRDDLEKFYSQADAFLFTSNYEGWGLVIIEAASYGLPIIMTDVGCAGEVIKGEESGIVIPVGEQKKLEESMIQLIEDKNLREKLGNNARLAIKKLPTKKRTLELYKQSWEKANNR